MDCKERFITLCKEIKRDGIEELMKWLEDNGFYESPASSRFHGAFEVKSVNISNATPAAFDGTAYKLKVEELKKCYKQASKLTGYIFYLPVYKGDEWHITQLLNGEEKNMTLEQFKRFAKTNV